MRGMLAAAVVLFPLAAAAQQPPATFLMPAATLGMIRQYLGSRPHDEVAAMISMMETCAALQAPDKDGRIASGGACRAVSDAMAQQAAERAKLAEVQGEMKALSARKDCP